MVKNTYSKMNYKGLNPDSVITSFIIMDKLIYPSLSVFQLSYL